MESEKVKEIKKALEDNKTDHLPYIDEWKCKFVEFADILTYINELESENERLRLERDVLIGKKIVEKQKHDKAIIMKIDIQKQLKNRIAELEKEIENGTLIELPCKVGDTVYQFDNAGNIYESKIKQLIYDTGHISFDERAIGTSIFLTKAEVEARLKELQEKQK